MRSTLLPNMLPSKPRWRAGRVNRLVMVAIVLGYGGAEAAERKLSWEDSCRYTIRFDPAKYDEAKLRNTVHLLFGPPDFEAPTPLPVFEPKALATLDAEKVSRDCNTALETAGRLEYIPLPDIDDYRSARIAEVKDSCDFELALTRGYKKASALRDYQPAGTCARFVDALEGKTDLQQTFRQTLEQTCANNANPKECAARELAGAQKPDGSERVRLFLINFGWNNCVVNSDLRNADAKKRDAMRLALEKQFRKLFKVKQDKCEAD